MNQPQRTSARGSIDVQRLELNAHLASVEWHDEIGSTNDLALARASQPGLATPCLIGAEMQTQGRGRGQNRWWSGPGALTFSLVFDPAVDLRQFCGRPLAEPAWPRVSLCAAVALCDLLQERVPALGTGLKWPNDVLVGGRKLAGILLETALAAPGGPRRLIVGVGINVNNSFAGAPADVQALGVSLADATECLFDRTEVVACWIDRFLKRVAELALEDPAVAQRWRSLCALSGRQITLVAGDRTVSGRCGGIDNQGALLVETPQRQERLFAGAVVRAV